MTKTRNRKRSRIKSRGRKRTRNRSGGRRARNRKRSRSRRSRRRSSSRSRRRSGGRPPNSYYTERGLPIPMSMMEKFAETKKKAEKRAENKSSAVRSAARRSGERAKTKKASRTLVEDAARLAIKEWDKRKRREVFAKQWGHDASQVALTEDIEDWANEDK